MPHIQKIDKPWGYEEILESNKQYLFKRLFMKEGHKCSLQYHNSKRETLYVLSGLLKLQYGTRYYTLKPGEHFTVPTGVLHRMEALEDTIYLESSGPYPDDVERVEDNYGREVHKK